MEYRSPESLTVMPFYAALHVVDPYQSVKSYVEKIRNTYHDGNFKKFLVIGFGKASYPMAKADEDHF